VGVRLAILSPSHLQISVNEANVVVGVRLAVEKEEKKVALPHRGHIVSAINTKWEGDIQTDSRTTY
jgi:hypothetical protein